MLKEKHLDIIISTTNAIITHEAWLSRDEVVTARHMCAAAAASAPDHGGSMSLISKGQAGNVHIRPTALLKAPFFSF
jgi:hypothetical protein